MTHPDVLSEMPESATQPQSEVIPSDAQPITSEPPRPQEDEPPARWRVSKSAVLLIGGPLAGALLVWLALSIFGSSATTAPVDVAEQPAPEPAIETQAATETETQPATEAQSTMEGSVASSAEAEPAPVSPAAVETVPAALAAVTPAPADPQPRQQPNASTLATNAPPQPNASTSATNEVTPKVPQSALNTISGTVRVSVRVTIDNQGAVVDATAADPGPSRYFERLSVDASKKWTFAPADSEGQRTMLVKFNFTREGVTAQASADEQN